MSNVITLKTFKKVLASLTVTATVLSLSGLAVIAPAYAVTPASVGLTEGDPISAVGSNDPDIYIINEPGYKRLFLNPVIFNFYAHIGWSKVKSVASSVRDAFPTSGLFRNCETNDPKVYGVEVTGEDTGVLHWVNTTGAQAVADDPNFFNKVFCINNNEFNWYAKGSDYTSVNQVPDYSRTPGATPTPSTGPLSASLANDNPASGTLVETQALADIAHFNVMGSGAVTSVELKRLGVSADTTLEDVFLFVNGVRVSDSGSVASGMVTFNNAAGLFTAPATLVVKADIADSTSGQTVGVQLTKLNTSTVSASGNVFTIAPDNNLATVAVGVPTGPGSIDPQNDVAVWTSTFTISNEDVYLKRLSLREIGSIDNKDVKNLRLFVDGVQVATDTDLDTEGYATFLLNQRILTGSRTVKVLADVVGGSSRTMEFSLRGSYDLEVMDESYNVNVEATGTFPADPASASTIGSASVTAVKTTTSPSGDVVDEAYDVPLAKFELQAFGEAVKIETLAFRASVSDSNIAGLTGGRVLIDGVQYGSTDNTFSTTATSSFTVNYTLAAGAKATVEVRADMREEASGTDVSTGDVISIMLDGGDLNNGTGQTSATAVDVPATSVEGNNVTVATGSATLSAQTSYPNQVVTLPKTQYKVGSWVLVNGSAEAINLTNLSLDVNVVDGTSFNQDDLTNLYVMYGGTQSSTKSTVTAADNDFSISRSLAKNETIVIDAYATLGTNVTVTDSFRLDLSVTATGASTGAAISGLSDRDGQTIDTAAGTFASSVDSGAAKLAVSNSAVSAGTWRFTGLNENYTITELRFKVASGSEDSVTSLVLKANGVAIGSPVQLSSVSSDFVATFSGLNLPVGSEKILTVDVNTADVGPSVATGDNVAVTLEHVTYSDSNGVETTSTTDRVGANIYVHDAYPTLSANGTVSSTLSSGVQTLAQFAVAPAGANAVGVKRVKFNITKSSTIGFASESFKIYENGSDISSAASISDDLNEGVGSTSTVVTVEFTTERTLSSSTVYRLEANVAVWAADTFVTTTINQDSATATPAAYSSVAADSTFTWSDRSGTSSASHSETTADWMNSFLLPGLPLSWGKNS